MPLRFAYPGLWWIALLPLIALTLWGLNGLRRRRLIATFGELPLVQALLTTISRERRLFKRLLLFLGLAALSLAALRPQYGRSAQIEDRAGIDIAIAFDVSKSMLARDLLPSRIGAARSQLKSLLQQLKGHRIALVPFAGIAFTQSPLTADQSAIRLYLDSLNPQAMTVGGTNLAMAIDEGVKRLTGAQDRGERGSRSQVLLLITDGEDLSPDAGEAAREAASRAQAAGVIIYAIAVGTPSGEPIPILNEDGGHEGYQLGRDQRPLYSQLNIELLRELTWRAVFPTGASLTGELQNRLRQESDARVILLDQEGIAIRSLATALNLLQRESYQNTLRHRYNESYHYAVIPALFLLLLELLISERRRRRS